ncbi:MAG: glycine--tRNA ligase subunit beta [Gammaproteobacteria bacterium]|nr:glycine--tRNA ligase subunit beta [Gammaproteobacteria bacterium]
MSRQSVERKDFLLEIGCEELPPLALTRLANTLADGIGDGLRDQGFIGSDVHAEWYASPRRLGVKIPAVLEKQDDRVEEKLGPPVQAAYKDGKPTKAAEGFAASVGANVEELGSRDTDKGERLAFTVNVEGARVADRLFDIVNDAIRKLPVPKRMRWGAGDTEFSRPVHWIVMLLGDEVVEGDVLGVRTGRTTFGHRFHAPGAIEISSPSDYPGKLEKAHVKVNTASGGLTEYIREATRAAAESLGGVALGVEGELPEEVAALNEWPVPVVGNIPERFLELPEEVLVTTLEVHQRYFPLRDKGGKLMPNFITFANIESKDPDKVRAGNERVVVPRLEDAEFFWNTDRKRPLADRIDELDGVTFQKQLGSIGDKIRRVESIASEVAALIDGDIEKVKRASKLAKADLVTDMVFEFTELQGVIGRYYAEADGEDAEVAMAIFEQYLPRFAGDDLPATKTGQAVAIADKLDTITGIFAIDQKPTGSKDPFALRRQALGLLRTIIEQGLDIDLVELVDKAFAAMDRKELEKRIGERNVPHEIVDFLFDRLKAYYQDRGIRSDIFEAVRSVKPTRPLDFDRRVKAVQEFLQTEEATALAAANKRISNILKKADGEIAMEADANRFQDDAEKALGDAVAKKAKDIAPLAAKGDYAAMLAELAELRPLVDRFFDDVMVMADDAALKNNRLALLNQLRGLFNHTADFAQIQVEQ